MTGFGTNQILARRLRIGFANSALFRERFLHHHCPRADYLSLNIGGFLPGVEESAKNPIQPWSPVLITCLKPSLRSNNAWFSDCKSNYENPVNPSDFGSYEVVAATTLVESNQKPSVLDRAEYFYRRLIHCRTGRCWALFEQNVNLFSNYANFFYERCHTYFGGSGPVLRWFTL